MEILKFLKGFNPQEINKVKKKRKKNYTQQTLDVLLKYEFLTQLC